MAYHWQLLASVESAHLFFVSHLDESPDAVPKLGASRGAEAPVRHVASRPGGGHHIHRDVHLSIGRNTISRDLRTHPRQTAHGPQRVQ